MSFFSDLKHKPDKEKHRSAILFTFVISLFILLFWFSRLNAILPTTSGTPDAPVYDASVTSVFEAGLRSLSENIITGLANSYVYFSDKIRK